MNIWICKRPLLALCLLILTAGCSDGTDGFTLLQGGKGGGLIPASRGETRPNVALVSADMVQGGIRLVPPAGFCIDKRTLRQNFAVLARCDSLGGRGGAQDAPLGLITVSVTPSVETLSVGDAFSSMYPDGTRVLDRTDTEMLALAQVSGPTPDGTSATHWRGLTQIGTYLVSILGYGADDSAMAGAEGGRLIAILAEDTRAASLAAQVARGTQVTEAAQRAGLRDTVRGLFNRKTSAE